MGKQREHADNVAYIKLPAYQVGFMRRIHGYPMVFGSLSPYSLIMTNHLVSNRGRRFKYTRMSFSEYEYKLATTPAQIDMWDRDCIPNAEEIPQLVPIVIPRDVIARDDEGHLQCVETNQHYQLTKIGAQMFREQANKEFWTALGVWVRDGAAEMLKTTPFSHVSVSKKSLVLQFMEHYGIDTDDFENIYRNFSRQMDKM